jgi:hypothetical protein
VYISTRKGSSLVRAFAMALSSATPLVAFIDSSPESCFVHRTQSLRGRFWQRFSSASVRNYAITD